MTTLPLSPAYQRPVWTAVALQVLTQILFMLLVDGGLMASVGLFTMAAFWVGVGAIMWRRPMRPTRLDLVYVRWGYLPLLVVSIGMTIGIAFSRP